MTTGQTDAPKPWTQAWTLGMQPFMKSMFPGAADADKAEASTSPIEEHFAALNETWKQSIEKWATLAREGAGPGAMSPQALRKMFAPARWSGPGAGTFDSGLREVLEGPKFATMWDMDREILVLQQRAAGRSKHVAAYQAIVQKAWNTAFERFAKSFTSDKTETPATWRALTDRWLAIANETLIEARRTDAFVSAQSSMLRSASDYRLQERKLAEAWCTASHIPTRSEMDEMQRDVTELRRALRLLRRQVASASLAEPVNPSQAPTQRAARAPTRKPRAAAAKKTRQRPRPEETP